MKKLLYILFAFLTLPLFNISAQESDVKRCATMEYLEILKQQDPTLAQTMERNEQIMQDYINQHSIEGTNETITVIPVVVHVIWRTAAQNISDDMINSQIRVFNEDFRKMEGTPGYNTDPVGADTKIEFRLADRDPNGNPHTGINRVQTNMVSWNIISTPAHDGQLKALSYWPSANYLNLWVANLGENLLGYAQFPGGPAATDGVVILWSAFGYNSPAFPYNLGRTATHEVGHWVNLRHIWGDVASCGGTDFCNDTPPCSDDYYSGVPSCPNPTQCGFTRMIENYMDYSDDGCMNIYTVDQTTRMTAAYNSFRSQLNVSFRESLPVTSTGVDYTFTTPSGQTFATLNFSSLGTADSVTVEVWPRLKPLNIPPGSKAVNRYFDINANGTGFNATLTVYYNDAEVTGFTNGDNNLQLYRYDGSNWTQMGGTVNTTANTVTLASVTDFSVWALADPTDNPLPVELTSFNSFVDANSVTLSWVTATEINSYGFNIERASILQENLTSEWESIGFVQGNGTTAEQKYYSFSDAGLNPGNYLYRLKIIDNDGSFEYSNVVNAHIEPPVVFALSQNYPNPFNPATTIKYQLAAKEFVTLKIFDALGVEIASLINEVNEAGIHEISFDASELTSGVYFYTLQAGSFVKTNKMLLMK